MSRNDENIQKIEQSIDQFRQVINGIRKHNLLDPTFSRTQFEIITSISDNPGQTTSNLATQLHVTRGSITQTVDTLVRRDLVTRTVDVYDRRIVRLDLTEAGRSYAQAARAAQDSWMASLVSHLTQDEVKKTLEAFDTLHTTLLNNRATIKESPTKESAS